MHSNAPNGLRVMVNALYADSPDGPSVQVDRMSASPDEWLRDHRVYPMYDGERDHARRELVAIHAQRFQGHRGAACRYDHPLLTLERAIAALELAHAAPVAAGTSDFVSMEADERRGGRP